MNTSTLHLVLSIRSAIAGAAFAYLSWHPVLDLDLPVKLLPYMSGIGWILVIEVALVICLYLLGYIQGQVGHAILLVHAWLQGHLVLRLERAISFLLGAYGVALLGTLLVDSLNARKSVLLIIILMLILAFYRWGTEAMSERLQIKGYLA